MIVKTCSVGHRDLETAVKSNKEISGHGMQCSQIWSVITGSCRTRAETLGREIYCPAQNRQTQTIIFSEKTSVLT